jgi:hypothetical protein
MDNSITILSQLLSFLPKKAFNRLVGQHDGDRYVKKLTAWNQFVLLLYAQASCKDSLREIETGINTHENSFYHLGIKSAARSSLSYANKTRDYEIFEKLFYLLFKQFKGVVSAGQFKFNNPLYIIDSTTVSLCLSLFNWAKYGRTKGAIKLHTILDSTTMVPEIINITAGKPSDISAAKQIDFSWLKTGSIIVFDRGYIDYKWWSEFDEKNITFVSRTKKTQNIFVVGQHNKDMFGKGILADEIVAFGSFGSFDKYEKELRRVRYFDEKTQKEYEFLTNNFELRAKQIADIYKSRWQIELFFKWIKQNLKIKTFLGTSKNAVMTQIWIAMIYYLFLSYLKFQTKFGKSLLVLTRMIKEVLMFKRSLIDLLSLDEDTIYKFKRQEFDPQLSFW